jgi:hypothetical protein
MTMLATRALFTGSLPAPAAAEDIDAVRATLIQRTTNWTTEASNDLVEFDTVVFDDDSLVDLMTSTTKIGPVPASYDGKKARLTASVIWLNDLDTTSYAELKVFRNGEDDPPVAVVQHRAAPNNTSLEMSSPLFLLAEGDYFELVARTLDSATAFAADPYSLVFGLEVYGL